jgi:polyadenylate-binding protein
MMQPVVQQRAWGAPQGYGFPAIVPARPQRGGRGGNRGGSRQAQRNQPGEALDFSPQSIGHLPVEQQRLLLGEKLYPLVAQSQPDLAGKITGMFLDSNWSIDELFSLLQDGQKLAERIEDAVLVLQKAAEQQ